ncbi:hypothetical protein BC829DRAFT_421231 [Chytridium lagenaria]|nr:hypothetical protein BC829DRAFT_421231 [Chytridium lagenaria]
MGSRPQVLFLLTSSHPGVSAKAFIQSFTVCSTVFAAKAATPDGRPPVWSDLDDGCLKWFRDRSIRVANAEGNGADALAFSKTPEMNSSGPPLDLSTFSDPYDARTLNLNQEVFAGLVVPCGDGWALGYFNDTESVAIKALFEHLVRRKRPICLIGGGTAALFSTRPSVPAESWIFEKTSLTAPSSGEALASRQAMHETSIEDFIKIWGGRYSAGRNDVCHVVIDDHIVTGQNRNSNLIAIQNFILISRR